MEKQIVKDAVLTGERALFASHGLRAERCVFEDGESPLKESSDLSLEQCLFRWKYPLWYCKNVELAHSALYTMARAGIWYTENISLSDVQIEAPKNFRRCRGVKLTDVSFSDAAETLWSCRDIEMKNVLAKGDYLLMNSENIDVDRLTLYGNYSFDGTKNVHIRHSRLLTKDAFWNSENVTVEDSFISGEYLGWNAKNLTLINCTVESLQGMCYIEHLVMKNCRLINTTLAFEYSSVDAEIEGKIDSVMNPTSGRITADHIDQLILEPNRIDPKKTTIICKN